MPWVYMLRCADGSLYVGSTRNLESRLQQHSEGLADAYTSRRQPVKLVWQAEYDRVDDACEVELKIKGWRREKKLALIDGRFADLPRLSRAGSHRRPAPG